MDIKGKVVKKLPLATYGKEGKQKGGLVIVTDEKYPKNVAFTAFGQGLPQIEDLKPGDAIVVHFKLESREWNDKWFTDAILTGVTSQTSNVSSSADFLVPDQNDMPF